MARPKILTPEVAALLCERLADNAGSLHRVCKADDMPLERNVRRWCLENPSFEAEYARAKLMGIDASIDETLEIADDTSQDFSGEGVFNSEHVQRSKLRIETRRWIAERTAAKKYGLRSGLDLTNSDGTMGMAAPARAARAAALLKLAEARKALEGDDIA